MMDSLARTTRRIALSGAVVIGMAGGTLGLVAQGSVAHADGTVTNFSVPSTAGPAAGFGTGTPQSTLPADTGLIVGSAGITFVTFSADTSPINLRSITDTSNVPVLANGDASPANTTYAYGPTADGNAALPSAPFGALLYRIGTGGTIQRAPFVAPSLGPTTIALPAGHDTGNILLFVNDSIYGDNTGSYNATVTVQTVAAPTITKAFSTTPATNPLTVNSGQPTTLTFTIANPGATALTGIGFTDVLAGGLAASNFSSIAATPVSNTCGGTVGVTNPGTGSASLSLSGGVIAANATCVVTESVIYTLASSATTQQLTNTTSLGTFSATVNTIVGTGTIAPASNSTALIISQAFDHLALVSGNNQVTPATAQYACPLVVQAQDVNNNPVITPINVTFTINPAVTNGAGASFTAVGTTPPFSGATTTTTVATNGASFYTVPAGCQNAGTKYQGVAVVTPYANQSPSLPSATPPPALQQYTIVATAPNSTNSVTFSEANGQQVARSCSVFISFFSSAGTTQFSLRTGNLDNTLPGGQRTVVNYLSLKGPGVSLQALPITNSVICQLPYTFTPEESATVRLPQQVDFNATVSGSNVPGLGLVSGAPVPVVHVTILRDLGAPTPVESVTITSFNTASPNTAGSTTYFSFGTGTSSIAPRTFAIKTTPSSGAI